MTRTAWILLGSLGASAGLAQVGGGNYVYTAELEERSLRQGVVFAGGLNWSCRIRNCTVQTGYAALSLQTCIELASQVGAIDRFGRPGWRLPGNDMQWCNAYATTEDAQQSGVTVGGGPGMPSKTIPLPGGSPKRGASEEGQGADAPVPAEPATIERIEYREIPGGAEIFVRGAHFPTPRSGRSVVLLPTRRSYCLAKCQEQYQPYEDALGAAQPGLWEEDLISVEVPAFSTDPYTLDQYFAQLLTMVESHYVEIRSGAGQPQDSGTVPIVRFGKLDTDVDRDGHADRRLGGDDCNDRDATVTAGC